MQRRIVEPADVSGGALAELKSWLGITRPNEDALLIDLLHMALSMCEEFTGRAALSQLVEERMPVVSGETALLSRPVSSISSVELIAQNGDRTALASEQFETDIQTGGELVVRLFNDIEGQALAVTARGGIAEDWQDVPAPLKQGIIRLCAYHYHDRDRPSDTNKQSSPPAIVGALWRPWRTMRLT